MTDEQKRIVVKTVEKAIDIIENTPLKYHTSDEHAKLEAFAYRCIASLKAVAEFPASIYLTKPKD